jgi:hypothetical protein
MISRCKAQRIEIKDHVKVENLNFKIYMVLQESECDKKSVCYYIDLTDNKIYVVELRFENSLIGQNDHLSHIKVEIDIDSAENVFHEEYFMSIFKNCRVK